MIGMTEPSKSAHLLLRAKHLLDSSWKPTYNNMPMRLKPTAALFALAEEQHNEIQQLQASVKALNNDLVGVLDRLHSVEKNVAGHEEQIGKAGLIGNNDDIISGPSRVMPGGTIQQSQIGNHDWVDLDPDFEAAARKQCRNCLTVIGVLQCAPFPCPGRIS